MSVDHEVHHDVNFQDVSISSHKEGTLTQTKLTQATERHKTNRGMLLSRSAGDYRRMNAAIGGGNSRSYLALIGDIGQGRGIECGSDMQELESDLGALPDRLWSYQGLVLNTRAERPIIL
jgi:hypothetical protein